MIHKVVADKEFQSARNASSGGKTKRCEISFYFNLDLSVSLATISLHSALCEIFSCPDPSLYIIYVLYFHSHLILLVLVVTSLGKAMEAEFSY